MFTGTEKIRNECDLTPTEFLVYYNDDFQKMELSKDVSDAIRKDEANEE